MKLITKALEKTFAKYPLYSQDGKGYDATVIAKFFLGRFTWYVTEAEKQSNGDYLFFGLVDGLERELGYFTLSELQGIRSRIPVERDMHFANGKVTLNDVIGKKRKSNVG